MSAALTYPQSRSDDVMHRGPQFGILALPPQHLLVAALGFAATTAAEALSTVASLSELLRHELAGDLDEITASTPKDVPASETGEVGVADGWEQTNLTVDLGISANGFTKMGIAPTDGPADLIEVPWASFGPHSPSNPGSGDLVLHIRADNVFAVEHVLRRIEHSLSGKLQVLWTVSGTQRYVAPGLKLSDHGRAFIGFLDGLANLDPRDPADLKLIFTDPNDMGDYPAPPPITPAVGEPGYAGQLIAAAEPSFPQGLRQPPTAEPAWTAQGTYMFVRASTFNTPTWDKTSLGNQEAAVGRFKSSGAPLDLPDTSANVRQTPTFASDPTSTVVPENSHIRRANPRSATTDRLRRVLRRGYPLVQSDMSGLQRGLAFVSFSRSLSTQPEFIMAAWLFNENFPSPASGIDPLLQFETEVLAGGYYFVPALKDVSNPTSWDLPGI